MAKKHVAGVRWIVEGFDGTKSIFRETLAKGKTWPEPRIIELLRRLVCRHLTASDVISGSLPPQDRFYSSVLKDSRGNNGRITLTVGENPYYVASLYQADETDH
jgi:hypothetical protein